MSCAERGFLLARVRDELNLTLLSYQTLYESSLAFGVRKALQAEIGRTEMEEKIEQLKHVEQQLECQKTELRVELERNAKRAQEDMESLKRQHAEEVEFLQQSNKQLKVFIALRLFLGNSRLVSLVLLAGTSRRRFNCEQIILLFIRYMKIVFLLYLVWHT